VSLVIASNSTTFVLAKQLGFLNFCFICYTNPENGAWVHSASHLQNAVLCCEGD